MGRGYRGGGDGGDSGCDVRVEGSVGGSGKARRSVVI